MSFKIKKTTGVILLIALVFSACEYEKLQPFGVGCDSEVSYKNEVMPIINTYCIGCHVAGSGTKDFTSWPDVKSAADNGTMYNRLIVVKDMPPAGSPAPSDEQIKKINCWIKQGALNN